MFKLVDACWLRIMEVMGRACFAVFTAKDAGANPLDTGNWARAKIADAAKVNLTMIKLICARGMYLFIQLIFLGGNMPL